MAFLGVRPRSFTPYPMTEQVDAWRVFGFLMVPALLVAACGEALWLGAGRGPEST